MEYYSCKKCVDIAIDEAVDETELPPNLELISEEKIKLSTACSFCEEPAVYIITSN